MFKTILPFFGYVRCCSIFFFNVPCSRFNKDRRIDFDLVLILNLYPQRLNLTFYDGRNWYNLTELDEINLTGITLKGPWPFKGVSGLLLPNWIIYILSVNLYISCRVEHKKFLSKSFLLGLKVSFFSRVRPIMFVYITVHLRLMSTVKLLIFFKTKLDSSFI